MLKVSIITPVYNGEKYIKRYLDSIFNQTYKNIELIIIDDGSNDSTAEIIKSYIDIDETIQVKYMYQENGGQASAIDRGIKYVTGDYLVGADADDYFELDAIQNMLEFITSNKGVDIIRANAVARDEITNEKLYNMYVLKDYQETENFFEDLVFSRGINCFTGIYMINFKKYKQNNPELKIYNSREGQNWQLLLPAAYNSECLYLDKVVYNYVIRKNSHSRIKRDLEQQANRINGMKDILKNTLEIIHMEAAYRKNILEQIEELYNREIYILYCKSCKKDKVKEIYGKIIKKRLKDIIAYLIGTNKVINKIYWILKGERC